jgi:hypothetical protein
LIIATQILFTSPINQNKKNKMNTSDFTTSITVGQSPAEIFDAVNNPRGWWSEEIEGPTDQLNAEFNYHYEDAHRCKMKITEFIPDQRVVWLVLENDFKFTKDKREWTGNKIIFDIRQTGDKTQLQFTQVGLVPEYECFEICEKAWTQYVQQSLRSLITTGKGQPNGKDKPQTDDEKKLSGKRQK